MVDAIYAVADFANSRIEVNDIKIEEKIGNTMDTTLVNGVVIDKIIDNSAMPRAVENAKVLLIDEELEGKRTRTDAEISINSPHQIRSFLDKEHTPYDLKGSAYYPFWSQRCNFAKRNQRSSTESPI